MLSLVNYASPSLRKSVSIFFRSKMPISQESNAEEQSKQPVLLPWSLVKESVLVTAPHELRFGVLHIWYHMHGMRVANQDVVPSSCMRNLLVYRSHCLRCSHPLQGSLLCVFPDGVPFGFFIPQLSGTPLSEPHIVKRADFYVVIRSFLTDSTLVLCRCTERIKMVCN